MKTLFLSIIAVMAVFSYAAAQSYKVDTLVMNGNPASLINIVILGDGYTTSEQDSFRNDAIHLSSYIFTQSPWSNYKQYFNIFAIEVPSAQSGTSHPNTAPDCAGTNVPVISVSTYFGCTFDAYNIHRLVVPMNADNIAEVLSKTFPNYDQVMMIAHSPYYGGSGGPNATGTVNTYSEEIIAHEIGHSFAGLADEYWAGPQYAVEKPNLTQQSNPNLIKWSKWLNPASDIGIYAFDEDPSWYKPSQDCKMMALGNSYCSVCKEQIIETIHDLAHPIIHVLPEDEAQTTSSPITFIIDTLLVPEPNTLQITWRVDGAVIASNTPSFIFDPSAFPPGTHPVTLRLVDTSALLRRSSHFTTHNYLINWTVNSSAPSVVFPQEVAFGNVPISTGKDTTIWFHNNSSTAVTITGFSLSQSNLDFQLTDTISHSIKAHDSSKVSLRAKPTTVAGVSGTLTIHTNEGGVALHTIALSATGIDSKLIADPAILDFGSIDSGTITSRYFRISNTGSVNGSILSVSQPDTISFTVGDVLLTIPPGKTDSVQVAFHPKAAGTFSQNITLTSSEASPIHISLQGIGLSVKDTTSSAVKKARINAITASIYPNPATTAITISLQSRQPQPMIIKIISADGKVVREFSEPRATDRLDHTFDIADLSSGAYLVTYVIGKESFEERFVKY